MRLLDRLSDAQTLYEAGRLDGALLMLLTAVAGTAKLRYPKMLDRERFVSFVDGEWINITGSVTNVRMGTINIEYNGKMFTFGNLLYKAIRNEILHEGTMPQDVQVRNMGDLIFGINDDAVFFSDVILQGLANVVLAAPENQLIAAASIKTPPDNSGIKACMIPRPFDLRRIIRYDAVEAAIRYGIPGPTAVDATPE